ncbi:Ger(x)C family spore germination protein [Paenibacillus algorifonticola]|uniref:Ger(x)C family spore germination protein n=1 Tax=Paenibacillus algorifonticola TaxID=684063 RepID=UPI003D2ADE53
MSRTITRLAIIAVLSLILSSCGDQLNLENATIPLLLGMDLDKNDKFHFYLTTPVFSKNIKKKSSEMIGVAKTLRQSRSEQDAQSAGSTQGRNYQIILIGKRMLEHEGWFPMLDVIYRDARNTITDRVVVVDGSVPEMLYLNPPDQPMLPILLRGMVDTTSSHSETVSTTAHELHRQFFDKGVTPYVSQVKIIGGKVRIQGTALLSKTGIYKGLLNAQETVLMSILQKNALPGFSLSYQLPEEPKKTPFATNTVSFSTGKVKTKIKTGFKNNRFKFDIKVSLVVGLSEHLFPFDVYHDSKQLENMISQQVTSHFNALITKFQKLEIDPIGLGVYARAHEYKAFKKVEDDWAKVLSQADITVTAKVKIAAMGPIK